MNHNGAYLSAILAVTAVIAVFYPTSSTLLLSFSAALPVYVQPSNVRHDAEKLEQS